MKNTLIRLSALFVIVSALVTTGYAQAPSYKNFEWEVPRLGYGNLTNSEIQKGGISIGTELRYNINDFYSIGLGGDAIISISNINGDDADLEVLGNTSLSVDRYFSNTSSHRAFVGLSIGSYDSYKQFIRNDVNLDPFDEHSSIGFGIRGGYEIGHLRLMAQYQHSTSGNVLNGFSLTAGLTLWGGYKGSSN